MNATTPIHIIGAGLAGSEAAWQLAEQGFSVTLWEMRPGRMTPAHRTAHCAELVCSNSLRSDDPDSNAMGVLHRELRSLASLIMQQADAHRVPAGSALAVDREGFSQAVTQRIVQHPRITLRQEELCVVPEGRVVIASGPLTSDGLAASIEAEIGQQRLAFFDAIAPIVALESIDFSQAWRQSRYDKGEGADYINCALEKDEYEAFVEALLTGDKVAFKDFEKTPYFEGCMPVEEMARRGRESLRFGPMKPVGLSNPHREGRRPYAVVQLRQDNQLGTLWNMVGFQTKLTWPEQQRVFRMIPGLQQAEFLRLGSLHRNTFIDTPRLLDGQLRLKKRPEVRFAGQIIGVEGYLESTAMGLWAALCLGAELRGQELPPPPLETALGALLHHVTAGVTGTFQPMNINFGLFPPLAERNSRSDRKLLIAQRAKYAMEQWQATLTPPLGDRLAE